MQHEVQERVLAILSQCHDMAIGTVRPDGAPQVTVVSFVHDGMLIYFGCGANSQKARNIAREARVSVAMTAPYADWMAIKGLSLAAEAEEVRDAGELGLVWRLMNKRFPQIAEIEAVGWRSDLNVSSGAEFKALIRRKHEYDLSDKRRHKASLYHLAVKLIDAQQVIGNLDFDRVANSNLAGQSHAFVDLAFGKPCGFGRERHSSPFAHSHTA